MHYIDHKKIAVIHIVKKELQLSDEAYRKILKDIAGVSSAKLLTDRSFQKLMYHFVRSQHYRAQPDGITLKQKLFIGHLLEDIGWNTQHAENFIKKYYHTPQVDALNKKNASKFIEALKHIAASQKQKHPSD
jgi:phage gp16-like protein